MNNNDALRFCRDMGTGIRLPTKDELDDLMRSMSPDGRYVQNLLPGNDTKGFWSSTLSQNKAFYFSRRWRSVRTVDRTRTKEVRCVVDASPKRTKNSARYSKGRKKREL